MNRISQFFFGVAEIRLEAANPERCLNRLAENGIAFCDTKKLSSISISISVNYRDRNRALNAIQNAQGDAIITEEHPGVFGYHVILKRPVLICGIFLAILSVLILPKYVWVITVDGNELLSDDEILRAAQTCSVQFGAKNSDLDSQVIKNRLLQELGSLQWAAVNCSGGICEIRVKERVITPDMLDHRLITDIAASRSGTITEVRVLEGTALCEVGDTVEAGQLLVSGVLDPAVHLRTVHAQAEIYAVTNRESAACIPLQYTNNTGETHRHTVRFIQFGRIRIKISGNSRICTMGCDKMITRNTMTLPGGYTFPLSWITETCIHRGNTTEEIGEETASTLLRAWMEQSVHDQMIAGTILSSTQSVCTSSDRVLCTAQYICREMIAREQEVNLFGSEQYYGRTNSERRTH